MHVQVRGEFINNFKGSVFWLQPPAPLPRHIPILWVLLILGPKVKSQFAPMCCILPTTAHIFATKVWEDKKEKKVNGHFPHSLRTPAPWTVRKTSFLESYALAHIVAHLLLLPQDHLGFRIQKNRKKRKREKKTGDFPYFLWAWEHLFLALQAGQVDFSWSSLSLHWLSLPNFRLHWIQARGHKGKIIADSLMVNSVLNTGILLQSSYHYLLFRVYK